MIARERRKTHPTTNLRRYHPNSDGEKKKKKKKKKKKNGTIPGELKKINFIIVDHGSC
ncbi:MAG: hypothetical protein M5E90_03500 [Asgard group archaeon]|nr:hypothetical protein [Asgard group archaeon]